MGRKQKYKDLTGEALLRQVKQEILEDSLKDDFTSTPFYKSVAGALQYKNDIQSGTQEEKDKALDSLAERRVAEINRVRVWAAARKSNPAPASDTATKRNEYLDIHQFSLFRIGGKRLEALDGPGRAEAVRQVYFSNAVPEVAKRMAKYDPGNQSEGAAQDKDWLPFAKGEIRTLLSGETPAADKMKIAVKKCIQIANFNMKQRGMDLTIPQDNQDSAEYAEIYNTFAADNRNVTEVEDIEDKDKLLGAATRLDAVLHKGKDSFPKRSILGMNISEADWDSLWGNDPAKRIAAFNRTVLKAVSYDYVRNRMPERSIGFEAKKEVYNTWLTGWRNEAAPTISAAEGMGSTAPGHAVPAPGLEPLPSAEELLPAARRSSENAIPADLDLDLDLRLGESDFFDGVDLNRLMTDLEWTDEEAAPARGTGPSIVPAATGQDVGGAGSLGGTNPGAATPIPAAVPDATIITGGTGLMDDFMMMDHSPLPQSTVPLSARQAGTGGNIVPGGSAMADSNNLNGNTNLGDELYNYLTSVANYLAGTDNSSIELGGDSSVTSGLGGLADVLPPGVQTEMAHSSGQEGTDKGVNPGGDLIQNTLDQLKGLLGENQEPLPSAQEQLPAARRSSEDAIPSELDLDLRLGESDFFDGVNLNRLMRGFEWPDEEAAPARETGPSIVPAATGQDVGGSGSLGGTNPGAATPIPAAVPDATIITGGTGFMDDFMMMDHNPLPQSTVPFLPGRQVQAAIISYPVGQQWMVRSLWTIYRRLQSQWPIPSYPGSKVLHWAKERAPPSKITRLPFPR